MLIEVKSSLAEIEKSEFFKFVGEFEICMCVKLDGNWMYFYREFSDHLFKIKRDCGDLVNKLVTLRYEEV